MTSCCPTTVILPRWRETPIPGRRERKSTSPAGPVLFCHLCYDSSVKIAQSITIFWRIDFWNAKTYWFPRPIWTGSGIMKRRSKPCLPPGRRTPLPVWTPSAASRTWRTASASWECSPPWVFPSPTGLRRPIWCF